VVTKILFVCGKNRRRSPTAEEIFAGTDGIEVSSAGTSPEADCPVSADLLDWADKVFVMETSQRRYLNTHFGNLLKNKRVLCLSIPDNYEYMQPELVAVLRTKVLPLLRRPR
jgi:predicted protein tyrosine phosphatase